MKNNIKFSPETYSNSSSAKTLSDYLKFFTTEEGAEMTPYIYLDPHNYYNKLIKDSPDYYLCRDHIELIKKHQNKFTTYLADVTDIIEIGPGSEYVIKNKTIPILNYAQNLKSYQAIDICKNYLDETCSLIQTSKPNINVYAIEADLMQKEKIELVNTQKGKKCIIFLGGTLANFHENEQNQCLKQINSMLNPGDLFIITVDTNQDANSLLSAYYNSYARNLFMGVINYFASINESFQKYASSFELKCSINKSPNFVDLYFVSNNNFSFHFPDYGDIIINEGQAFRGIRAHKSTLEESTMLFNNNGFEILEILNNSNKMQEFICKKV